MPTATPPATPDADLAEFARAVKKAEAGARIAAEAARNCLPMLVAAALDHTGQGGVILRWLASCYNASEAPPVPLDEIRRLDWDLREGLLAVMLACNQADFPDTEIRQAFFAAGGAAAVDRLHAVTGNKAQHAALERVVSFIRQPAAAAHASRLRAALLSAIDVPVAGAEVRLSWFEYLEPDLRNDTFMILDAMYGHQRGKLTKEDVRQALTRAGLIA